MADTMSEQHIIVQLEHNRKKFLVVKMDWFVDNAQIKEKFKDFMNQA